MKKINNYIFDLKDYDIEIRCGKINGLEINECTWPDNAIIQINGIDIVEYKALVSKLSLKKRKDSTLLIGKHINMSQ